MCGDWDEILGRSIWLRVKAFRAWASVFGGFEGSIWLKVKLCGVWVGALGG